MLKVLTHIKPRSIVGAYHQDEGVIIEIENGIQYSFVPEEPPIIGSNNLSCTGVIYEYQDGKFGKDEFCAVLFVRNIDTPDEFVEIDVVF